MSMPAFPDIPPELTCEHALNMILASIASEELALSNILNAESEKLIYILDKLKNDKCGNTYIKEILEVNESVTSLIDSVSQNQMLLKSKMEKTLRAMRDICPICPQPCPQPFPFFPPPECEKCCAVFTNNTNRFKWDSNRALHLKSEHSRGNGICLHDNAFVEIEKRGFYLVNLIVNARAMPYCNYGISFYLKETRADGKNKNHNYNGHICSRNKVNTVSLNGIIVDNSSCIESCRLSLYLRSPNYIVAENVTLSIIEI